MSCSLCNDVLNNTDKCSYCPTTYCNNCTVNMVVFSSEEFSGILCQLCQQNHCWRCGNETTLTECHCGCKSCQQCDVTTCPCGLTPQEC